MALRVVLICCTVAVAATATSRPLSVSTSRHPRLLSLRGGFIGSDGGKRLRAARSTIAPGLEHLDKNKDGVLSREELKEEGAEAEKASSSIPASVFNVVNNIAGAGILTLPRGMAVGTGWVPSLAIVTVISVIASYTFCLIGNCCHLTGQRTFKGLWQDTLGGRSAVVVDLSIFLMCFSACVVYGGIIGDVLTPILRLAGAPVAAAQRGNVILAVVGAVLLPLTLLKSLAFLAYTSLIGLLAVVYTTGFMALRAVDGRYASGSAWVAALAPKLQPSFLRESVWKFDRQSLVLVSNLGMALICHYNAPTFYRELKDASPARFNAVSGLSFSVVLGVYATCVWAGYKTFGDNCQSNILLNYHPSDVLAIVGRAATALSVVFGFPLAFVGLRESFCGICQNVKELTTSTTLHRAMEGVLGARVAVIVGLLSAVTALSIIVTDIGVVVSCAGALLGAVLVYCLPVLIYVQAVKKYDPAWLSVARWNLLLLPFGAFLAVLGVYMALAPA